MDEELTLTRAQLAERIGYSASVIRKWERVFSEFVTSPPGVKGSARPRVYNLDDVLLFGTVAQLRTEGRSLDTIAAMLPDRLAQARARVDEALGVNPLDAALGDEEAPPGPSVAMTLYVDVVRQLEATEGELRAVGGERDYLRDRIAELEDKLMEATARAARAEGERDMLAGRPPSFWRRLFGGSE